MLMYPHQVGGSCGFWMGRHLPGRNGFALVGIQPNSETGPTSLISRFLVSDVNVLDFTKGFDLLGLSDIPATIAYPEVYHTLLHLY